MIRAGTDDADLDAVARVPSCKAIEDIDEITGVQVINRTFTVDLEGI